ncbi:MAG: xanthine dehydrogenase family protein subunit M [Candidatus Binatia bacterium]
MKPPRFDYAAPTTVAEAVALLQQHDTEAKILAGGQSLMPLLNMRLTRPGILVDLGRIPELNYIRQANGTIAIGAMTTKRSVQDSDLVESRQPLLHAATALIGHGAIRNRGTVGGSLAHADPAAEYPAIAVALDAELQAVGPNGARTIKAADFFVSYLTTALEPAEILTEVQFPVLAARTGWSCLEVVRRHGDFAMAGAAVTVTLAGDGRCSGARIVLFGVGAVPLRAAAAEQVVIGQEPGEKAFHDAGQQAAAAVEEPMSDVHASGEYRRYLAQVMTRRALAEAVSRAGTAA